LDIKGKEIRGGRRKLLNEALHNVYCSLRNIVVIKPRGWDGKAE
jgi:hypothetical protein